MSIICVEDFISSRRNDIVINEAYIGKTRALLEIEKEFNKLRSEKIDVYSDKISQHPCIIKINRLFEEQFGMYLFALKIINTKYYNAYTHVIASNFDVANNMDLPSMVTGTMGEGFRWKPNNGLCIIVHISAGMIADPNFTDAQLVGVILHEIGHNFADALYGEINIANKKFMQEYEKYLSSYATILGFILALPYYLRAKKLLKEYNNSTRVENEKHPKKKGVIRGIIDTLGAKYNDYKAYREEIIRRKKGGKPFRDAKRKAGSVSKSAARGSLERQNEVFSDKFAGVYGYSVEISEALKVMDYTKSDAAKELEAKGGKLAEASRDYDDAVRDICDFDCHPNLVQRLNEEIKLLEREVAKDDIDPKCKLVIYNQLETLKNLLDKITKTSKLLSKDENAINAYNDYVNKNCPDAVSDEIEDKIEVALDKLLEEDKKKNKK